LVRFSLEPLRGVRSWGSRNGVKFCLPTIPFFTRLAILAISEFFIREMRSVFCGALAEIWFWLFVERVESPRADLTECGCFAIDGAPWEEIETALFCLKGGQFIEWLDSVAVFWLFWQE
jgi:hypothetical protein